MTLTIKRLRPQAVLPARATEQSAGLDLCACIDEELSVPAGETRVIPTGIAAALPEGTVGLVFGRSGLGICHGLAPANAVGVIDADYRGEILVGLRNYAKTEYIVRPGERIAQLVVTPILLPEIREADELPETARGAGGFGSTGRI